MSVTACYISVFPDQLFMTELHLTFLEYFHHFLMLLLLNCVILKYWNRIHDDFLDWYLPSQHQLFILQKLGLFHLWTQFLYLQTEILFLLKVKTSLLHLCVQLLQELDQFLVELLIAVRLRVVSDKWSIQFAYLHLVVFLLL